MTISSLPIGQVRFDRVGSEAYVDYSLDPIVRGRGWGREVIRLGVESYRKVSSLRIIAKVKLVNETSSRVFISLGFVEKVVVGGSQRIFILDANMACY
jgi:RimJ/RimL family protein N-acetyltransferase